MPANPKEKFKGERDLRVALRDDLPFYAERALQIATKSEGLQPLKLNRPQRYIHRIIEAQLKETGKVRVVVLKGRQMGCSTYIAARFYHAVNHNAAIHAFVLSHASDTTGDLFEITKTFQEHLPEFIRQEMVASSSREIKYGSGSSYHVGTAKTEATGRGSTIHRFHGSEVAYWANAEGHKGGIMQAVPSGTNAKGSEIILESTAHGVGGTFHKFWKDAVAGIGEYIAIFTPWFWDETYTTPPPKNWEPSEANAKYAERHGLSIGQTYWMHCKRVELGAEYLFKQEFPATPGEAFQVPGDDSFITPGPMFAAMEPKEFLENEGPMILSGDPNYKGSDDAAFALRQGRRVHWVKSYTAEEMGDTPIYKAADMLAEWIDEYFIDMTFIDIIGYGAGVRDILVKMGYGDYVRGVNVKSTARDDVRYGNLRANMWGDVEDWLQDEPVELPQMTSLARDLLTPQKIDPTAAGKIMLESKASMRGRGAASPNEGDAVALTFAYPVSIRHTPRYKQEQAELVTHYDPLNHQF